MLKAHEPPDEPEDGNHRVSENSEAEKANFEKYVFKTLYTHVDAEFHGEFIFGGFEMIW